jgi:hypothetical protein
MLLSIDRRSIQQSRRKTFQRTVTEENFEKLSIYHRLLYPCTQAVKFFEQDRISLCHVYPALKALKRYFTDQADTAEGESPELMEGWNSLRQCLHLRQRKLLDRDLARVAFWLTSFGYTWLATRNEPIHASHQLRLTYEAPRSLLTVGTLDAAQSVTVAGRANDNEDEVAECPYLGDTITDESLEDVPTIDVPKRQTLTFIREVLVKYLLDEVPTSTIVVDDRIDQADIGSTIRTRFCDVLS